MAEVMVEVMGVVLAIIGWCLESSSTNSAVWRIHTKADSVMRSSSQYEGLWKSCSSSNVGVQCVTHPTTLGLPAYVQACRALMIIALLLGLASILLSVLGLKCTKLGGMKETSKGRLTLTAGLLFILSGLCVLTAVSWYASRIIQEFNDPFYVGTRSELGTGLYLGWAAAACVIMGGAMLCGSFKRARSPKPSGGYRYKSSANQQIYKTGAQSESSSSRAYV
ncbi:claudin 15-like b isoform X1 [Pangasianodon hypophthalmus]|uniref:claudin 15-like b isoform X1 n=1 Tax=Pangasianodon hypophthalmus TaxID=310915 RepID=UPI000EFE717E|nr:claudin 15-like b isoform X1 [Pangasianodon hypophthalmus]XP_026799204.1 claudin 15-like b isoform X1 [Pangasianodon hypophthalmus]